MWFTLFAECLETCCAVMEDGRLGIVSLKASLNRCQMLSFH